MNINDWKQKGSVYFWKYISNPKNYAGWHLTCNKEGCDSVLELIGCFIEGGEDSRRTLNISAPGNDQLKVPNCSDKSRSPIKLVISYRSLDSEVWDFSEENGKLVLSVGVKHLSKFKNGLVDISQGKGDYSIGNKGQELWFWWQANG